MAVIKIQQAFSPHPGRDRQSFNVNRTADQYRKMQRELYRFEAAQGSGPPFDAGDHAINFCIAAWQLLDWLRAERDHIGDGAFLRALGLKPGFSDTDLCRSLFKLCPELRVCRVAATSAKHVRVTKFPDSTIKTYAAWLRQEGGDLWVVDFQGMSFRAIDLFRCVASFWSGTLASLEVIEPEGLPGLDD